MISCGIPGALVSVVVGHINLEVFEPIRGVSCGRRRVGAERSVSSGNWTCGREWSLQSGATECDGLSPS